jgi:hypothetical protein
MSHAEPERGNRQPEGLPMSAYGEQPQEWTVESVHRLVAMANWEAHKIACAHNATLAAEREFCANLNALASAKREEVYEQQLAAERERREALVDALRMIQSAITLSETSDIAYAALSKAKEDT